MVKKHSTSKPGGGRTNAIFKIAGAYSSTGLVLYLAPPGAHFKEKKSNKPKEVTSKLKMVSAITILLEYIHCSSDLHEEQVKSGRVGCYSCPDAKTVCF